MRVLVCGDRNWDDGEMIFRFLSTLPGIDCIIEGEARGADRLARNAANKLGIHVESYPTDWNGRGRAAGIIRNAEMLSMGKPNLVVAFHDDIINSKGTGHMVRISREANIPTLVMSH